MGLFWLVLALMTALAVLFLLWPIWRAAKSPQVADPVLCASEGVQVGAGNRENLVLDLFNEHLQGLQQQLAAGELEQGQFEQLKKELELSLLEDMAAGDVQRRATSHWGLYLAVLVIPAVALGFYWQRGAIEDVNIVQQREAYFNGVQSPEAAGQALEEMVSSLKARLEQKPDNLGNRYLLARSYMQQGDYLDAVAQYTEIVRLSDVQSGGQVPAHILGELAQAVFLAAGNRVTPEVEALVGQALQQDANETTSLGLAGIAAFEAGRYSEAVEFWQHAVQLMGPHTAAAESLLAGIARARQLAGGDAGQHNAVREEQAGERKVAAPRLEVQVRLADDVDVNPDDTVFVYARAWQGAKMPLAIQRLKVAALPATITLDESMAMAPGMSITSFPDLEIVARISKSGQPVPQSGDWQGSWGPVSLGEQAGPVEITVNQQIP